MTRGSALLVAVGVITAAALVAVVVAKRAKSPRRSAGAPPPPPAPPGTVGMAGNSPADGSGAVDRAVGAYDDVAALATYKACMATVGSETICSKSGAVKYLNPITAQVHAAKAVIDYLNPF